KTSGKLLRLVREGETFIPPSVPFQKPRFGRSEDDLSERERWHIDLYHRLDEPESEPPRPQERPATGQD
ncbi:MAG: hypothetical protein KAT58_02325, partial [candidate division Zixibacteria bacterium]|nr:hypothetical protein [candidate division Zixibacteria bacterium]